MSTPKRTPLYPGHPDSESLCAEDLFDERDLRDLGIADEDLDPDAEDSDVKPMPKANNATDGESAEEAEALAAELEARAAGHAQPL